MTRPVTPTRNMLPIVSARCISLVTGASQVSLLSLYLPADAYVLATAAIAGSVYFGLFTVEATTLAFQRNPGSVHDGSNFIFAQQRWLASLGVGGLITIIAGIATGYQHFALALVCWGTSLAAVRFISAAWLMWGQPWRYAGTLGGSSVARTVSLATLLISGVDYSLSLALAGLASCLVLAVTWPKPRTPNATSRTKRTAPWTLGFSTSLALASLCVTVLQTSDRALLAFLDIPSHEAAQYAAMSSVSLLTTGSVFSMLSTALYPRLISSSDSGNLEAAGATLDRSLSAIASLLPLAYLTLAGLRPLIEMAIGSDRFDAPMLVSLTSTATLFAYGHQLTWIYHINKATNTLRKRSYAALATPPLILGLGTVLGAHGVAIGFALGAYAYSIAMLQSNHASPTILLSLTSLLALSITALHFPQHSIFIALVTSVALAALHYTLNHGRIRPRPLVRKQERTFDDAI